MQQDEIRMFAAQMMEERAAPAADPARDGRDRGGSAARERKARSEFAGRFREFASAASQNRFRALTRAAA